MLPTILSSALLAFPLVANAALSALETHVNTLDLGSSFNPVKAAYWTALPHHRRTPFAISPDGTTAYLAYLDNDETKVHVLEVDPTTFAAKGTAVTIDQAYEAGGLVAQNDGFAILTNTNVTGTDAPTDGTPVPVIIRYTSGTETWRTFVAGPGVHTSDGLEAAIDMNGDLVYSEKAGMYGAYFVVSAYSGWAEGHFGDSIEYVSSTGELQTISGASSSWGCSHNTGIAFEAADAAPFASICAEDQGDIWLNTATQGMAGQKIAGENTTNGASGIPMGGMSGSYSALALFPDTTNYIFAWRTRGCVDLTENTWMGTGYTQCSPRMLNGNVGIALMTDKETLSGSQASSTVGATDGDSQLNWLTKTSADHVNVHVATFDSSNALVTWDEIASPSCDVTAMDCYGTYSGSYYQLVNNKGEAVGDAVSSTNTYVSGDIVNIGDKLCWPYVSMTWDLSLPVGGGLAESTATKMSFACISAGGSSSSSSSSASSSAATSAAAAASTSSAVSSSVAATSVAATSVAAVATSAASSKPATTLITSTKAASSSSVAASSSSVSEVVVTVVPVELTSSTSSATPTTIAAAITTSAASSSAELVLTSTTDFSATSASVPLTTASPDSGDDECEGDYPDFGQGHFKFHGHENFGEHQHQHHPY